MAVINLRKIPSILQVIMAYFLGFANGVFMLSRQQRNGKHRYGKDDDHAQNFWIADDAPDILLVCCAAASTGGVDEMPLALAGFQGILP